MPRTRSPPPHGVQRSDGDGWALAPDNETTDGTADHCYFNDGSDAGRECLAPVDPLWLSTAAPWGRAAGAAFLEGLVDP
ncbi:MAG: hypothetical protein AB1938_31845 [Myxococcota bacterium]